MNLELESSVREELKTKLEKPVTLVAEPISRRKKALNFMGVHWFGLATVASLVGLVVGTALTGGVAALFAGFTNSFNLFLATYLTALVGLGGINYFSFRKTKGKAKAENKIDRMQKKYTKQTEKWNNQYAKVQSLKKELDRIQLNYKNISNKGSLKILTNEYMRVKKMLLKNESKLLTMQDKLYDVNEKLVGQVDKYNKYAIHFTDRKSKKTGELTTQRGKYDNNKDIALFNIKFKQDKLKNLYLDDVKRDNDFKKVTANVFLINKTKNSVSEREKSLRGVTMPMKTQKLRKKFEAEFGRIVPVNVEEMQDKIAKQNKKTREELFKPYKEIDVELTKEKKEKVKIEKPLKVKEDVSVKSSYEVTKDIVTDEVKTDEVKTGGRRGSAARKVIEGSETAKIKNHSGVFCNGYLHLSRNLGKVFFLHEDQKEQLEGLSEQAKSLGKELQIKFQANGDNYVHITSTKMVEPKELTPPSGGSGMDEGKEK